MVTAYFVETWQAGDDECSERNGNLYFSYFTNCLKETEPRQLGVKELRTFIRDLYYS